MATDAQLLDGWRRGERSAGQELIGRHYQRVLRFFELRATWAAEDLTQKTFLACVEHPDRVRNAEAFSAFLFGIARRELLMHLRQIQRGERAARLQAAESSSPQTGLSTLVSRHEEQRLLLMAMVALPVDLQIALTLHYWEKMRSPEIADVLGIAPSSVRRQLTQARQQLRELVGQMPGRPEAQQRVRANTERWLNSLTRDTEAAVPAWAALQSGGPAPKSST